MYRTASRSTVLALGGFGRTRSGFVGGAPRGALVGAALVSHLFAQRPLDGLRHPRVQRHAVLGRRLLGAGLDLLDQAQGHPADVSGDVLESLGRAGGFGGHLRPHLEYGVVAVQTYGDHPVAEFARDLRRHVRQCLQHGQAGGRSDRCGEGRRGPAGLFVAEFRGGDEGIGDRIQIRIEAHDAIMTSYVMSVKASECSPRSGAAPRGATVDWIDNLEENRWRPSQSRSRSGWWPRPSSSRPPTCPGRPTPTAERHSPSSQAGRATRAGPSRTPARPPMPDTCATCSRSGTCPCSSTVR
ncbi:hypothetical protein RHRU231_430131 [Rhodococcus ruber]|uniref:Uncharacterized protein n=1 Tax=Rhodococcus ruber TaxID=1830 RepID=A0A098BJ66_9NOCA|nr:hypothetical protein RHRU231_430131 [Rhodococcus ruber]